eukprot:CAMPEP_0201544274 /NCGR_PEP_ID=MMETSP0173_2-20130828/874_1 /ASSEMBLY_ACC=CAM_ASM_000268 /TAXON_ID=218659 /ORGANISM="Vexillifera sp., Strain DIVA3 564/2" /LENGTH=520 /DNA_ID=CAMNT_0047952335 /DNA_START=33 /DNA_END=1595 /DNA_ORIENTATION=-
MTSTTDDSESSFFERISTSDWYGDMPLIGIYLGNEEKTKGKLLQTNDDSSDSSSDEKLAPGFDVAWECCGDVDTNDIEKSQVKGCDTEVQVLGSAKHLISIRRTSTYPHLPGKAKREGEPIADAFSIIRQRGGGVIVSLADGCNWGAKSRNAAVKACDSFARYVAESMQRISNTLQAGHFLLRGFAEAHSSIMEDGDDAGTTTLLGGILVRLDHSKTAEQFEMFPHYVRQAASSSTSKQKKENARLTDHDWAFICCSVGDCKAFAYSVSKNKVHDITFGNRFNVNDATDPGGRLGPYLADGEPDLRNLRLYYVPCKPGDQIVITSDGVYDNLDPQTLGLLPSDLDSNGETWAKDANEKEVRLKNDFAEQFLLGNTFSQGSYDYQDLEQRFYKPDGGDDGAAASSSSSKKTTKKTRKNKQPAASSSKATPITPDQVTDALIAHCCKVTQHSRDWLKQNPRKRLPLDFTKFPGKMDHTTALSFSVLPIADNLDSSSASKPSALSPRSSCSSSSSSSSSDSSD